MKEKIKKIIKARIPVILLGPPGVGKNFLLREVAGELNLKYLVLEGTSILRDDVNGLSIVVSGKTIMTPSWIIELVEKEPTLLVIDEISSMKEEIQTSLHGLFHSQERRVGSFLLPDHVYIAATGNDDGDHVLGITSPILNRAMIVEFKKPTDPKYKSRELVEFLTLNRDLFFTYQKEDSLGPWPTPRTWGMVDELIAQYGIKDALELGIYAVGREAMIQFQKFVKEYKADIYEDPMGWALGELKKGKNVVKVLREVFEKRSQAFTFVLTRVIENGLMTKPEYRELVKGRILSFLSQQGDLLKEIEKNWKN